VRVTGNSPAERGAQLGRSERDEFVATLRTYDSLFAAYALGESRVRALAEASRRVLEDWAPDLAAEADALADAAGVDRWRVHALNARTEILAAGGVVRRGECSTIALRTPRTLSAQTWDWHRELAHGWQVVQHVGTPLPFVTLTERGMLGKIGINAAGVGLHFNILGHASDSSVEGVPVHGVARRVLDSATDVAHAEQLIRSAPLQASSCYTVVDAARVACLEASPAGVGLPPSDGGPVVHTNHFLDPALAPGDLRVGPEPDTLDRLQVLEKRAATLGPDPRPEALVAALQAHDDPNGAPVCCHAAPSAPLGDGWETLATVVLEPARHHMRVLRGGPCQATVGTWQALTAGPERTGDRSRS
jgi:isopenicillin-N N-acyltransferase like protein